MWQEWTANGAISAVLVRDLGPGDGDPKIVHIDANRDWGDNNSRSFWVKVEGDPR